MSPRTWHYSLDVWKVAALSLLIFAGSPRSEALDATAMQSMLIVEGDVGRGSAFIVTMDGRKYVITNSHVVRGNGSLTFKDLRNVSLDIGPLEIAENVDAVRAEVTGVTDALELEPDVGKISIGDEVVVAGNSDGEGVIREIPGKVVGIGPERIEVDAPFVQGNSGSPILLKSTGKVIGVATYMKVPRKMAGAVNSPLSLHEVRRFGYRLDTVGSWVRPKVKDRLYQEGLKLAEMDNLMSSIVAVFGSNAALVSKLGSGGFVKKESVQQYPAFNALALTIDDFGRAYTATKRDDLRTRDTTTFFDRIKGLVSNDVRGLSADQFTGFYAIQLKQELDRIQEFSDWCGSTMMPAFRQAWLAPPVTPPPQPAIANRSADVGNGRALAADAGRPASAAELAKPLAEFLAGTKWYWEGSGAHLLEFRRDKTVNLDYWTAPTSWKVTAPNEVTFTMRLPNMEKTSTITFSEDRSSFTGHGFNKQVVITKCPRASGGN